MRSLPQIIHDNGGDNTPILDTHNLTGRALPEGVEPEWTPLSDDEGDYDSFEDMIENQWMEDAHTYAPLATLDELLDCE